VQQLRASRGRPDARHAPVAGIDLALDQTLGLENGDYFRNGRRAHLLGPGEIAEGDGAAEDDDGEGRELGGREPGGVVLAAEAPEEVKGGGVEAVGEVGDGRGVLWMRAACAILLVS